MKRSKEELKMLQALPLEIKVAKTKLRIREWYEAWGGEVYVSFSGGKDSTVLLHIVREMYPDVEAVFVNTGLEYPEIQKFAKTFDNVTILRPKMRFDEVIKKYGYPIISKEVSQNIYEARSGGKECRAYKKFEVGSEIEQRCNGRYSLVRHKPLLDSDIPVSHMCCMVMKKRPAKKFEKDTGKRPIVATMASESNLRTTEWLNSGCNSFDGKRQISKPMSFWTEQDVLQYIKENNIPVASVYGDVVEIGEDGLEYENNLFGSPSGKLKTTGCDRTGCIFCAFGCHLEKGESRFERLKQTHPRQYEYCIGGGEYDEDGIWKPSKEGLGMGHVFDELNKIYGDGFIRY